MQGELLERATERGQIARALADAAAGTGRLLLIEGPAGIGKSSLLDDTAAAATDLGIGVLRARAGELEREFAFGLVGQLFEPDASPPPPGGDDSVVLAAFFRRLAVLAAEQPLLLALDDLHWADAPSLRFVDYASRRPEAAPVVIAGTVRTAEPGSPAELIQRLRDRAGAVRVTPRPLSPAATAQLARAWAPDTDEPTCQALHEASAGNPFLLEELLRAGPHSGPEAVREASVAGLSESLNRRIAPVPDAPALVAALAVLGDHAALADAVAVAGLPLDAAAAAAKELHRIGVLASEDPAVFSHPVVRRSCYDALSVTERTRAHRAAADVLEGRHDAVAAHLLAVAPDGSSRTAARLLDAARDASAHGAHDVAVVRLERALAEDAAEPDRVTLLEELGIAQMTQRRPEAVGTLMRARELAEPAVAARLGLLLAELHAHTGDWDAADQAARTALAAVGGGNPALADELVAFGAAIGAFDPARVAEFDAKREELDAVAEGSTWGARALALLLITIDALRGAAPSEVRARLEALPDDGLPLCDRAGAWAASWTVWPWLMIDAPDEADAAASALATAGEASGSVLAIIGGIGFRACVALRRGDLAAAEAGLLETMQLALEGGVTMGAVNAAVLATDALLERPGLEGIAGLVAGLELPASFAATATGAMLLDTRGRLALARGDRAAAARDLRAAGEVYEPLRFGPAMSPWRSALAIALLPGERDSARRLAEEELSAARSARSEAIALRALGLTATGEESLALLSDARDRAAAAAAPLELARSHVELGAALRRAGRRRAAREELAAGLDLAHRCGALRLSKRAEDELRADGARPRRAATTGVEALTASELRVARLAAEGRSNSAIAAELFVEIKTVETHLSRAYAKLGLSGQGSRARIAGALES